MSPAAEELATLVGALTVEVVGAVRLNVDEIVERIALN